MKRELEFYLFRIYLRPGGFWISVFELVFFDTATSWSLIGIGSNKTDGFQLELLTLEPDRPKPKEKPVTHVAFNRN